MQNVNTQRCVKRLDEHVCATPKTLLVKILRSCHQKCHFAGQKSKKVLRSRLNLAKGVRFDSQQVHSDTGMTTRQECVLFLGLIVALSLALVGEAL